MKFYQKWKGCAAPDKVKGEYFDVTVPGDIQADYARFMNWDDHNYMNNSDMYATLDDYYWYYKAELDYSIEKDERVFFVTKGIEYEYDVILNNDVILHHEGMFSSVEKDITDALKKGNILEIMIYPHPKIDGMKGRSNASQSCKPAVGYGWDWHPHLLVSGLWNDTYIETRGKEYIRDAECTYTLSDDMTKAYVHFEIDSDADALIEMHDMDGQAVYSGKCYDFQLDNINLWWCNGQGVPYLYTYKVISSENEITGKVGFKKIKLVMNGPDAWKHPLSFPKGRSKAPITIELNGREIFAKGSNWVNPEIFTALITPETYREQVELAANANMNILRCWGGAIIDKEPFFEACDELGIMIWQEFPLACNNYFGSEKYLRVLEQEARAIVKRVRRHACHVLWCGGNELFNGWSQMTEQSHALRLLDKICYEEDLFKPFIMTSPIKGMSHGGYTFADKSPRDTVFEKYRASRKTAYTEFGVPSMASIELFKAVFDEKTLHTPDSSEGSPWVIHSGFRAWRFSTWCCFDTIEMFFGKQKSLEDYIEKSTILQCEGYKCVFEEARKQAPDCSMAINWDYNEPWKNIAGNNLLEYPSAPKKAYYAVKDALRATMPSIRPEHFYYTPGDELKFELWILNDAPVPFNGDKVEVYFTVDGNKKHIITWNAPKADAAKNIRGHQVVIDVPHTSTQLVTVTLEANCGTSEYRFLLSNEPAKDEFIPQLNI